MTNSRNTLPILVVIPALLLLLAAGIWLFLDRYQHYEETVDRGWTREARLNPWLATQFYLEQLGFGFHRFERMQQLEQLINSDTPPETILITNAELVLTESRVEMLLDWTTRGGYLMVGLPDADEGITHPLLQHFGVTAVKAEDPQEQSQQRSIVELMREYSELKEKNGQSFDQWVQHNGSGNWQSRKQSEFTHIEFQQEQTPAEVYLGGDVHLQHDWLYLDADEEDRFEGHAPDYWAGNEAGTTFMEFSEGKGRVTFLTDVSLWNSHNLKNHDNAWLLWQQARGKSFALLYGTTMPTLASLLMNNAPELVCSFLLWLLAWLVYRGRRFGAVREQSFTQRRAIVEHIRACADYLWHQKQPQALLAPLQHEISRRCQQLNPRWSGLSPEQQHQWLASHSSTDITRIAEAMDTAMPGNESEFVHRVQALQKIRESI